MPEVLVVSAIVAYVIGRQLIGESLHGKRVVLLPVVLTVVGLTRLAGGGHPVRPVDMACLAVSGVIALGIGAGQGALTRLENRDGGLWGRMPVSGLALWAALVGSRVVMTLIASGLHAHVAASSTPIIMLLGLNRLGQAALITRRALSAGIPFAPEADGSGALTDRLADRLTGFSGPGARPAAPPTPDRDSDPGRAHRQGGVPGDRHGHGYGGYAYGPEDQDAGQDTDGGRGRYGFPRAADDRDDRDRAAYGGRGGHADPYDDRGRQGVHGVQGMEGDAYHRGSYDRREPYGGRGWDDSSGGGLLDGLGASLRDLRGPGRDRGRERGRLQARRSARRYR